MNRKYTDDILQTLITRGNELLQKPFEPIAFTKNIEADALLNDLTNYPHAFVLACIMDRQIKAERAWMIPYHIKSEIGSFDFKHLLELDLEFLISLFRRKSLHRFNEKMAGLFYDAIRLIDQKYNGDASMIWKNNPRSATIVLRFLEFKGVGVKIATMAANILSREFKIPMQDRICIDISPDVQVKRVFNRLGFISDGATNEQLIYSARELHPEYPGIFDLSCWEIGRNWCRPSLPDCDSCYLDELCPKLIDNITSQNPVKITNQKFIPKGEKPRLESGVTEKKGFFKLIVSVNQSIAEVISNTQDLPKGLVHFRMYDQANPSHLVFPGWKKTGTSKQNIYSYFKNTGGKALRYQMISEYMKVNKIDRIVLEIWDANHESTVVKQEPTTVKTNPDIKPVSFEDEKPKQDGGFKVVMICASRKNGNQLQLNNNRVYFRAVPDHSNNVFLPDDKMPESNMTWRDAIVNLQDHSTFSLKSYQLYSHPVYNTLYKKFGRDLYILSAGWGLVNADFKLPDYDITFAKQADYEKRRLYNDPPYADFNQLSVTAGEDIYFIGTPEYLKLFFECTKHLPNLKIIYYMKNNLPAIMPAPDNTFVYRRYVPETDIRTNWHYSLAKDFVNGKIP